jgi:hypothetical protein
LFEGRALAHDADVVGEAVERQRPSDVVELDQVEAGLGVCVPQAVGGEEVDVAVAADAALTPTEQLEHERVVAGRLHDQMPAWLQHAVYFAQRPDRIRDVLDHVQHHDDVRGLVRDVRLLEDRVEGWDLELLDRVPRRVAIGLHAQDVPALLPEGVELEAAAAADFDDPASIGMQLREQCSRAGHVAQLHLFLLIPLWIALGKVELARVGHQHRVTRGLPRTRVHQTAAGAFHDLVDLRHTRRIDHPGLLRATNIAGNDSRGGLGQDCRRLASGAPRSASLRGRMSFVRPVSVGGALATESMRRGLLVGLGVAAGAVLGGAATVHGYGGPLLAITVLLGLAWVGRAHLPYALPAALLILTMNGVPGLNMEQYVVPGSFRPEDVFVIGLIVFAAGRMLLNPHRRLPRLQRYLWIWSPIFLFVWLVAMLRGMDAGASWLKASLYGRDFLYFAVLAPLAGYLFIDREHRRRFILLIGCWTAVFSSLLILVQLTALPPAIVNPHLTNRFGGILRVYTPMTSLAVVAFSVSLAYVFTGSAKHRLPALLVSVVTGLVCVLALSRALYFGLIIGTIAGLAIWVLRPGVVGLRIRRRLSVAFGVVISVAVAAVVLLPGAVESSAIHTVSRRAESGVAALTEARPKRVSTLTQRKGVAAQLLQQLGDQWPVGLGFVPPSAHYIAGVPSGSIRNSDLGVLNGVMTIGIIGTVLLYSPIIAMLTCVLLPQGKPKSSRASYPMRFGLTIWTVALILSSVTLGMFFSTPGLALAALILGIAGYLISDKGGQDADHPLAGRPNA